MASPNAISAQRLFKLVGTPSAPVVLNALPAARLADAKRAIPASIFRPVEDCARWAAEFRGRTVVAACADGIEFSPGVAALLRHEGAEAEILEGGIDGWIAEGYPTFDRHALPARDEQGRTRWVTRARPKVDRIASPWLIRRFVDPAAVFLFVAGAEVAATAERMKATPFDIEGTHFSHRGDRCTFDALLADFGLDTPALHHLAAIVRGADTDRLDLVPEAPGLLALSLGLSRLYSDDLAQLEAGMSLYDALYRWARDASDETHNWPSNKPTRKDRE